MPYETDERLKSRLDTNQLYREQMCLALLAIDKRFSDVRPRHPRGGPDGGRDIEGTYKQEQRAYGAVGFVNQANDSEEQKKTIRGKFADDVKSALAAEPKPDVFVFFTNLNLTVGEKDRLNQQAREAGLSYSEIFDRERLRIALDSADGFSIRFQYLGVPLSEEEQASFFARWGDDIQFVIATGFQKIDRALSQLLFMQEARRRLTSFYVVFELDRVYSAEEIGHFRTFCSLILKEVRLNIHQVLFGSSDIPARMGQKSPVDLSQQKSGIGHGLFVGRWHQLIDRSTDDNEDEEEDTEKYVEVNHITTGGVDSIEALSISYSAFELIRFDIGLNLEDIDEAYYIFHLNASFAKKVKSIQIYANRYKLQEIPQSQFDIDTESHIFDAPVEFTADELLDPWVRIRPGGPLGSSLFSFHFSEQVPLRLFETQNPQTNPLPTNTESVADASEIDNQ